MLLSKSYCLWLCHVTLAANLRWSLVLAESDDLLIGTSPLLH